MKRRIGTVAAIVLVLALTACGEQGTGAGTDAQVQEQQGTEEQDKTAGKEEEPSEDKTSQDDAGADEEKTEEELREETENQREIEVYSSNEDATEFVTTLAVIPDLTAANILNELAYKNVIPEDITANSCKLKEEGGTMY